MNHQIHNRGGKQLDGLHETRELIDPGTFPILGAIFILCSFPCLQNLPRIKSKSKKKNRFHFHT